MRENKWGKALRILMIVIICAACLIPFYVLLVLSLNAPSRVFYEGNIFVPNFHWQNFIDAWKKSKIGTAMLNSAIITVGSLPQGLLEGQIATIVIIAPVLANTLFKGATALAIAGLRKGWKLALPLVLSVAASLAVLPTLLV